MKNSHHDGFKFAAINNKYPLVPSTRALFDPKTLTTGDAIMEKRVKDKYRMASDIVPMFPS